MGQTQLAADLEDTFDSCTGDAKIIDDSPDQLRITNIPHSGTHMLPGGMATLDTLGDYWGDWEIEYVDNDGTVMYGSRSDKDVVISRVA
jgi:hypothetical protein